MWDETIDSNILRDGEKRERDERLREMDVQKQEVRDPKDL